MTEWVQDRIVWLVTALGLSTVITFIFKYGKLHQKVDELARDTDLAHDRISEVRTKLEELSISHSEILGYLKGIKETLDKKL